MSTCYHFIKNDRRDQAQKLMDLLTSEQTALLEKLKKFGQDHPGAGDLVNDVIFDINQGPVFRDRDVCLDSHEIGVSTASKFHWRADNGFNSMEDVKSFLADNPDYCIEDEYQNPISLSDFQKVISSK